MLLLGFLRAVWLSTAIALLMAHMATAASPIVQLTNNPASDVRPAWSPDGRQVAFQSNRGAAYQIYIVNLDGSNERVLASGGRDDRHPAWSPDGQRIAVDSGSSGLREIWTIDLATGARQQVTRLAEIASFPSWSPDGTQLSFYLYRQGVMDLWAIGADGSNPRQLTRGLASEQKNQCTFACHGAAWSPDGQRVAYTGVSPSQVWSIRSSDGGDPIRVSPDPDTGPSHFPQYLPDGRLVYVTEHVTPGQSWTDLWVLPAGQAGPRQPLLEDVQAQGPFDLTGDGGRIVFASPRSGNFDIYVVELDSDGKAALKVKSGDTQPAAGLTPPAERLTPPAENRGVPVAAPPVVAAPAPDAGGASGSGTGISPYLAAVVVLGALWVVVEGGLWARRRKGRRSRGGS